MKSKRDELLRRRSLSLCGVEDFLQVVAAYREFVSKA
ncbi:Uncharacterised protein [Raoultella planticola]|uniref:Uncharacterized protein n=1 Tax=Raoultella planticola TaxID=575 RepID=A0A485B1P2_RAOPL|nr:Uncharacterised protein [Raoultella planticola]